MKNITQKMLKGALVLMIAGIASCSNSSPKKEAAANEKIGILLVNHGSPSETWRNALLDLEKNVRDSILKNEQVGDVKTAFMEYTEPSIATRLKQFDSAGYSHVVLVPVFLSVSSHSFDDIPTIVGQKEAPESIENLKIEHIERYTPKAQVTITPLLDFTDILEKNVLRRVQAISTDPKNEGLVLIAYGDKIYNAEWSALFQKVGAFVNKNTGIDTFSYGWCGHIVHYTSDSTTTAVERILKLKEKAVVVPVLVAHDENFQIRIIGGGIKKVKDNEKRVIYKPDAILPDTNVENWVIAAAATAVEKINAQTEK